MIYYFGINTDLRIDPKSIPHTGFSKSTGIYYVEMTKSAIDEMSIIPYSVNFYYFD